MMMFNAQLIAVMESPETASSLPTAPTVMMDLNAQLTSATNSLKDVPTSSTIPDVKTTTVAQWTGAELTEHATTKRSSATMTLLAQLILARALVEMPTN